MDTEVFRISKKEKKVEKIVKAVKVPREIAEWAFELSNKQCVWIADSLKRHYEYICSENKDENSLNSYFNKNNKKLKDQYEYILDWIIGRNSGCVKETDFLDFKVLTFKEALTRSKKWHNELAKFAGGQIKDEHGDVVMQFPDGFYWIRLNSNHCRDEADAMGHCGRGNGTLYSLRRDKRPHVTADINSDNVVLQMKGKGNSKPHKKYHTYILEFILSDYVTSFRDGGYLNHLDFCITDLEEKEFESLKVKKPSLFVGSIEKIISGLKQNGKENEINKMVYETDFVERIYREAEEPYSFIQLLAKEDLFGSEGLKFAIKKLEEKDFENQFIKLTSKEDYEIWLEFIKAII